MEYYSKGIIKAVQLVKPLPYKELFAFGCKEIGEITGANGKELVIVDGRKAEYGDYAYFPDFAFAPITMPKAEFEERMMPKDLVDSALQAVVLRPIHKVVKSEIKSWK